MRKKRLSTAGVPPTESGHGSGQPVAPFAPAFMGQETAFGRPRNYLTNRFVYTVISQRAHGLSIGINLNPDRRCNFDCIYCEVNHTLPVRETRVDIGVMKSELGILLGMAEEGTLSSLEGFRSLPPELLELKEVALSGDGEPTLSRDFEAVVEAVVHVRSCGHVPFFKMVLITNGAGLHLPEVQKGLQWLGKRDEIWVKLEAGTQEYMNKVNRPDVTLGKIMSNILLVARQRPVVIQSLFPLIDGQPPSEEEIDQYVHRLQELNAGGGQIAMVQVYSAHRPPERPNCGHLPLKLLSQIARRVKAETGLKAEVF